MWRNRPRVYVKCGCGFSIDGVFEDVETLLVEHQTDCPNHHLVALQPPNPALVLDLTDKIRGDEDGA